jgi:hypothetical protein
MFGDSQDEDQKDCFPDRTVELSFGGVEQCRPLHRAPRPRGPLGRLALPGADQTLLEIARRNEMSPQGLFEVMQPDEKPSKAARVLPDEPPQGFGRLSLSDVGKKYGLDLDAVLAALEGQGITAAPAAAIKEIAEQHGLSPGEIYVVIKGAVEPAGGLPPSQ